MKSGATTHHAQDKTLKDTPPLSDIKKLAPGLTPVISPSQVSTTASLQALQRHRLDRYYVIDTSDKTQVQAEQLASQLRTNPSVEMAEFEPIVDGMQGDNGPPLHPATTTTTTYPTTQASRLTCKDKARSPRTQSGV